MTESMEESARWARVARNQDMEEERRLRAQFNERIAQLEDALAAACSAESLVDGVASSYGNVLGGLQVDDPAMRGRIDEQRRQFAMANSALHNAFGRARESLENRAGELEEEFAEQLGSLAAEQEGEANGGNS